jgi:hypothetical protein
MHSTALPFKTFLSALVLCLWAGVALGQGLPAYFSALRQGQRPATPLEVLQKDPKKSLHALKP